MVILVSTSLMVERNMTQQSLATKVGKTLLAKVKSLKKSAWLTDKTLHGGFTEETARKMLLNKGDLFYTTLSLELVYMLCLTKFFFTHSILM
jgi:hypothetical protein